MVRKLLSLPKFTLSFYTTIILLLVFSSDIQAQCAGTDASQTVCDISNSSSQSIDLNLLLGSHSTGGTWTDDDDSDGLNTTTGVLNAQLIKRSGVYHYTYTVDGIAGCTDNSATITIIIGGYSGVPAPNASICSTETSYNLFQVFYGTPILSPQIGGTWHDDDNSGGLNTSSGALNASIPTPDDTYAYTYTIPAIDVCPAVSSQVFVSIYRSPEPGTPTNISLCSNQINSTHTNLDLNNQLSMEDPGGVWTESSSTTEISNPTDHTIDIQNIYNTRGPGTYRFTYTVTSNNTVCTNQSSTVTVFLGEQLDFTGGSLQINSNNVCEKDMPTTTYTGILKQGVKTIPDGSYEVTYTISGIGTIKTIQNFNNGVLTFPISNSYFTQVRDYTVTINDIILRTSPVYCSSIIGGIFDVVHIYSTPQINNASLDIAPVCLTHDATVTLYGNSNLSNGNYDIIYNLSGSNTLNGIPATISVTSGTASFSIPSSYLTRTGTTTIAITRITNSTTGCTNTSTLRQNFIVNPPLDLSNLASAVANICQGQGTNVKITGLGSLTSIQINYDLTGANTLTNQTITLAASSGEANFVIPATEIPNLGLTTFTITRVTNSLTSCTTAVSNSSNFNVNALPNIPTATDQFFCSSNNPTVGNLVPQGSQYQWFDSATSTVPLTAGTALITGTYYVKEVNATTTCESALKSINVVVNTSPQINNATLSIAQVCQTFSVSVFFSGISNLTDGNYTLLYDLSGSNTATGISTTLSITNKIGTFIIPSNLVPNAGTSTIRITNITNTTTGCTNTSTLSRSFIVKPLPDISNLAINIKNVCQGNGATIEFTGLNSLSTINVNYSLSGANIIDPRTASLLVTDGKASIVIPASEVTNLGTTTFTMTNISNTENGCSITTNKTVDFSVNPVPNVPVANNHSFCENDNATVANLVPNGSQYNWYDSLSSTTPLPSTRLLTTGNYHVRGVNASGCESVAGSINVTINSVAEPTIKPNGENYCGADKPTIQNLTSNTNYTQNFTWYDAASNGNALANTALLIDNATYYGIDYNPTTNCSSNILEVTVSLTQCNVSPDGLAIPDGFSPNGDGVNDTFKIPDIEFLFPNFSIEIFNRYGNVLFKGNINQPEWDGKNSNSNFISGDTATGVYFYIINYNKDNLRPRQGQLYLNR